MSYLHLLMGAVRQMQQKHGGCAELSPRSSSIGKSMKTLIIGLGNPILADDGIGIHVAQQVRHDLQSSMLNDVNVIEASVGGLRLAEMMSGYDRVIIVDAMTSRTGSAPGTVHRVTLEELSMISPHHTASAHDTTLPMALAVGRTLGLQLPNEIVIVGIESENVTEFGETLSVAVEQAVPTAVQIVLQEIFT